MRITKSLYRIFRGPNEEKSGMIESKQEQKKNQSDIHRTLPQKADMLGCRCVNPWEVSDKDVEEYSRAIEFHIALRSDELQRRKYLTRMAHTKSMPLLVSNTKLNCLSL